MSHKENHHHVKEVVILGDQSEDAKQLYKNVEEYLEENEIDSNLYIITDQQLKEENNEIRLPGLIVDNVVLFLGICPKKEELGQFFATVEDCCSGCEDDHCDGCEDDHCGDCEDGCSHDEHHECHCK